MFLESSGVTQIQGAHIHVHRSSLTTLLLWLPASSSPSHSPLGVFQPSSRCGHTSIIISFFYKLSIRIRIFIPSVWTKKSCGTLACLFSAAFGRVFLTLHGTTSLHAFHVRCTCLHLTPDCHLLDCLKGILAPSASASVDLSLSSYVCVAMNNASCCRSPITTQTHSSLKENYVEYTDQVDRTESISGVCVFFFFSTP